MTTQCYWVAGTLDKARAFIGDEVVLWDSQARVRGLVLDAFVACGATWVELGALKNWRQCAW